MKRYLVVVFVVALSLSGFAQAECAAFPCVVATVSLTNQSQAIPSTPIFTPPVSGVFRINAYLSLSDSHNHNPNAHWGLQLTWIDDNGEMMAEADAWQHVSNVTNSTFVVQDIGGQPLLYQTRARDGARRNTYSLYIVVEQLQ